MKNLIKLSFVFLLVFGACKTEKPTNETVTETKEEVGYNSYGDKISSTDALSANEMLAKFNTMQVGDTINVKFTSTINDVCSKKGCWMKLELEEGTETMVRFKDYAFFMPLDSKDKTVVVEGLAFVKETPVDELKHYAEDAGKSQEEIDKITEPKKEYAFEANGVLMKIEAE